MAALSDNKTTGFTGNGIQPAGKKGGKLADPPSSGSNELRCDAGRSGGSWGMGALDRLANDNSLIKKS
jgi:hypothetical protein